MQYCSVIRKNKIGLIFGCKRRLKDKAEASGFQDQGQGRATSRPRPGLFETKIKATEFCTRGRGQSQRTPSLSKIDVYIEIGTRHSLCISVILLRLLVMPLCDPASENKPEPFSTGCRLSKATKPGYHDVSYLSILLSVVSVVFARRHHQRRGRLAFFSPHVTYAHKTGCRATNFDRISHQTQVQTAKVFTGIDRLSQPAGITVLVLLLCRCLVILN